jgi:hypothetical protein
MNDHFDISRRTLLSLGAAGMTLPMFGDVFAPPAFGAEMQTDRFADSAALLDAFIKTEGDQSGETSVTYGYGTLFSWFPNQANGPLVDTELCAVRRYRRIPGGWVRLHREVGLYRDHKTKKILKTWYNPYIEREVEIIDLFQEFNRRYVAETLGKTWFIDYSEMTGDAFFQRNFFIDRPSPMHPRDYPLHSQDVHYELSEYVNYFAKVDALLDPSVSSAHSTGATNSIGNLLPWMEMGNHPGKIIHQIHFTKLSRVEEMPADFLDYAAKRYPKYLEAPTDYVESDLNNTSWTKYRDVIDQRRAAGTPKAAP